MWDANKKFSHNLYICTPYGNNKTVTANGHIADMGNSNITRTIFDWPGS